MILIKKAKGGYMVLVTAANNNILSTTEVLKTKAACVKNIAAQMKVYGSRFYTVVRVYDNTNNKNFLVDKNGKV